MTFEVYCFHRTVKKKKIKNTISPNYGLTTLLEDVLTGEHLFALTEWNSQNKCI